MRGELCIITKTVWPRHSRTSFPILASTNIGIGTSVCLLFPLALITFLYPSSRSFLFLLHIKKVIQIYGPLRRTGDSFLNSMLSRQDSILSFPITGIHNQSNSSYLARYPSSPSSPPLLLLPFSAKLSPGSQTHHEIPRQQHTQSIGLTLPQHWSSQVKIQISTTE